MALVLRRAYLVEQAVPRTCRKEEGDGEDEDVADRKASGRYAHLLAAMSSIAL